MKKEYFIEELSMLLGAGMPVITALSAIKKEIKSERLKKIIADISVSIESSSSLSKALSLVGIFPQATISLIRIGEESGRLAENLKVVAKSEQKEREFRSRAASAMMYPLFVFSLTAIVGLGVAWFILPRLATVFAQLKVDLPLITRWLINLGTFLGLYGLVVVPALLIVFLLALFFLFSYRKTNFVGQAILFAIPPISRLFTEMELSRLGSLLGSLLEAGLLILDSLGSLRDSATFYRYQKLYAHLHDRISEGNSFGKSFGLSPKTDQLIPVPVQQLIITGEQSGSLPQTLKKIGEMYEEKTETTAKNLTILLEPVLLVIVWLGVVAVALAVILPLYSLIGNLSTSSPTPQTVVAPGPPPVVKPKLSLKILETGLGYLNIRQEPLLTSKIVGQATSGATFEYSQKQGQWYQIPSGWVFADYVEEIK